MTLRSSFAPCNNIGIHPPRVIAFVFWPPTTTLPPAFTMDWYGINAGGQSIWSYNLIFIHLYSAPLFKQHAGEENTSSSHELPIMLLLTLHAPPATLNRPHSCTPKLVLYMSWQIWPQRQEPWGVLLAAGDASRLTHIIMPHHVDAGPPTPSDSFWGNSWPFRCGSLWYSFSAELSPWKWRLLKTSTREEQSATKQTKKKGGSHVDARHYDTTPPYMLSTDVQSL